jgi:hypothetical protein
MLSGVVSMLLYQMQQVTAYGIAIIMALTLKYILITSLQRKIKAKKA